MRSLTCPRFAISADLFLTPRFPDASSLQIELKAEDLYDKEKVDIETVAVEDVFKLLQCDDQGLNEEEARRRLEIFGPDKLESEEQNAFLQVSRPSNHLPAALNLTSSPSSLASCGTRCLASWRVPPSSLSPHPAVKARHPETQDFVGIVLLLFINSAIGFHDEERDAGNAVKAPMDSLSPKGRVRHDGK